MEKSGRGKRRSFSAEYKAEAVGLVGESGKSIGIGRERKRDAVGRDLLAAIDAELGAGSPAQGDRDRQCTA
jgi:hypothetical protein